MSDPRDEVVQVGLLAEGTHDPGVPPAGIRRAPVGVDDLATEHLIVNMGPQHPSTHGVLRMLVELDGEEIKAAEVNIGYLHRGIEKLAEHRRFDAIGTLMDRGDYVAGIMGETAVALAVERLMEIEVPRRAQWIRTMMAEVNRLATHLLWYGTMGLDSGAMGPFLYGMRDRESLLDILEAVTGGRMMFNYVRPGGVAADLPAGIDKKILAFCDAFEAYVEEHDAILYGNEIFQARLRGVGVIDAAKALAFGLTGPNLRASGIDFDVRKRRPYDAYPEMEFDVALGTRGDALERFAVRMEEMRQSTRILRQCAEGIPEGQHIAKVPKVLRPPAGEVYAAVESARGEVGIHMVTDGGTSPYRMHYHGPSLYALQALEDIMPGHLLADGVVMIGSTDIMLGEVDR